VNGLPIGYSHSDWFFSNKKRVSADKMHTSSNLANRPTLLKDTAADCVADSVSRCLQIIRGSSTASGPQIESPVNMDETILFNADTYSSLAIGNNVVDTLDSNRIG